MSRSHSVFRTSTLSGKSRRIQFFLFLSPYIHIYISLSGAEIKWIRSGTINRRAQVLPSVLRPITARNKREARHVRLDSARLEFRPDENFHRERVQLFILFSLVHANWIPRRVRDLRTVNHLDPAGKRHRVPRSKTKQRATEKQHTHAKWILKNSSQP